MRLLLSTAPEFKDRPNVGSVYSVCWVFSQGKGYLGFVLARDVGTINNVDLHAKVEKQLERPDAMAAP